MTGTRHAPTTARGQADPLRRTARVAGVLYLITFVTSIPAVILYGGVLNDPDYIVGAGPDTPALVGGFLEVVLAFACIGTAVVLYPVIKRHNETFALGFVTARTLEAALIMVGSISLLSVVTLRQDLAGTGGADPAMLVTMGQSLVAIHDWTFLLGPGVIPGVNALLLGYILYRSRLVPRVIPALGLIGAPLLLASATAIMFGVYEQVSVISAMSAIPIALWEGTLGVWLIAKGFRAVPTPPRASSQATGLAPPAPSHRAELV